MAREQVKRKPAGAAAMPEDGVLMANGARVEHDPWVFRNDDEALKEGEDAVVSLPRFVRERDALLARNRGRLGVIVAPGEAVEDLGEDVARLGLIAIAFPGFRDGRGFSSARLLRDRLGYRGELRAVGDVLADLLFYMMRCGFTSFTLRGATPEALYARATSTFSQVYQPASDGCTPVSVLRKGKPS